MELPEQFEKDQEQFLKNRDQFSRDYQPTASLNQYLMIEALLERANIPLRQLNYYDSLIMNTILSEAEATEIILFLSSNQIPCNNRYGLAVQAKQISESVKVAVEMNNT